MSDNSWVLRGVDPAARERAIEEAARQGVSLADYLTDTVLRTALGEQLTAMAAEEAAAPTIEAPSQDSGDGFAVRHRLKALERRLGASVGALDGTIHGLDGALFDITARVGEVEALAGDTAHTLTQSLLDVNTSVAVLRLHACDIETNLEATSQTNEAAHETFAGRCEGLDLRLNRVEDIAGRADRAAAVLADGQEALKYALASDFSDFARESAARLGAGLDEVRAAADAAAEHAGAAAEHLVAELRAVREAIEQRMADSAAETRARMHVAFAEASDRMTSLTDRVVENERFTARMVEGLRSQIADVEDAGQTALEETAEALRQAGGALAADLHRATQDNRASLESLHADLSSEVSDVRDRQSAGLARLKQVDSTVNGAVNAIAVLEQRIDSVDAAANQGFSRAREAWDSRFEAVAQRLAQAELDASETKHVLAAETHRVEACTLAALEKLSHDIVSGDALLAGRLTHTTQNAESSMAQMRERVDQEMADLRERQDGAHARLMLTDQALERATSATDIAALRSRVEELAQQAVGARADERLSSRVNDLDARLDAVAWQGDEIGENVQGVARLLERVSTQTSETASRADARFHTLELAVADLRLQQGLPAFNDGVGALEQRLDAFEQRQADALHTLRNDIAKFLGDNDRRLAALEASTPVGGDVASEFESLRKRIEDRIMGVEQRSVRTLEQVIDTVEMLEKRFTSAQDDRAAKTA